ncbi:MAG TPA: PrsW family glutamic-type intramembrane protease [Treponemataceae bacterium]|nr:PrsW family glutamic-type intramembrane protease [Treponemataceae bacterium]
MTLIAVLAVSFLPLAAYVAYLSGSGTRPFSRSLTGALWGLAAVLAASLAEGALSPLFSAPLAASPALKSALDAFLRVSLVEECAKFFAVALIARSGVDSARDSGNRLPPERATLALAVLVALSFAAFENLFYGIRDPGSLTARSLLSVPVHVAASMVSCLALVRGFRGGRYLLAASVLHASFNLLMASGFPFAFAGFTLVAVLALVAVNLWLKSGADSGSAGGEA